MEEESFGADQTDSELYSSQESHKGDRPYKCNQCDKSYRHAGSLVNHKKTHQVGLYTCLICQKEFSNPMGLKSHLRTHSEDKRFKCDQCGEAFRMSQQLYNHRRSSHGFSSVSSPESLARNHRHDMQSATLVESSNLISNLENYIAESMVPGDFSPPVSKYYQDDNSTVEEAARDDKETQQETIEETREVHASNDSNTEEYRYKCNQCEKAYKHAGSLANHRQSHMVGLYQCAICFKEFSNLMAMKNHCRLHSDSRTRQRCKSARYSGKTGAALLENTDTLQSNAWNPSDTMDRNEDIPLVSQVPESSNYEEDSKKLPSPIPKLQDNLYPDSFCSDGVLQTVTMDCTIKVEEDTMDHNSTFTPEEETGQPSEQLDETLEDGKTEDFENRPFKCNECGKAYRHAGSLINHKKTHQTGVYSCTLCSKQMYNMAALNNHFRAHFKSRAGRKGEDNYHSASFSDLFQNPEDPFQCKICGKYLPNESEFMQHQLLHQEEAIKETFSDAQNIEDTSEVGTYWTENPQESQNSYTSCPNVPNPVKLETEDLAEQQTLNQRTPEETLTTPLAGTSQNNGAKIEDTSSDFEQLSLDQPKFKEEPAQSEEHEQSSVDRPYKCEPCGRTYRHKSSLINHKLTHKTGIYQCSICPKQYSNLMALRTHLRFHSRSYSSRRGILSRRGRHGRTRFLQSKAVHQPTENVKLNENMSSQKDTNDDSAVDETLKQISCCCGESFDCVENLQFHSQMCQKSPQVNCYVKPPEDLNKETILLPKSQNSCKTPEKPESQVNLDASEHQGGRVYNCDLCNKSYRHSGSLINHKRTHQTGDYTCPYCSRHVHNMAALKNHIRIHHKGKKGQPGEMHEGSGFLYGDLCYPQPGAKNLFGCVSCEDIFHSEDDLIAHQMVHMALEGNSWEQKQESNLEEDAKSPSLKNVIDFEWGQTNTSGIQEDVSGLKQEIIPEDHSNHIDYTCVECGDVYTSIEDLNNHKVSHQVGIYQCSFCPKEYPNLPALRDHFLSHTNPLRNIGNGHSDGADSKEVVQDQLDFNSHYDCGHCGFIFTNEVDFHQHQVALEKQVMEESLPIVDSFIGKETEFSFRMDSSEMELLRRIKSELWETDHTEPQDSGSQVSHICGYCGQTYDDLESLQTHSSSHDAEEKPTVSTESITHDADTRDNALQQFSTLMKEEENSDGIAKNEDINEKRPYTCNQCGKSYRHGGSLVNHKKTHLVGNFQCIACSKKYPNMAAYINHLRHHPQCKQQVAANRQQNSSNLYDSQNTPGEEGHSNFSPSLNTSLPDLSTSHVLPSDFKPCVDTLALDSSCIDHSSAQKTFQTPANHVKRSRKSSLGQSKNQNILPLKQNIKIEAVSQLEIKAEEEEIPSQASSSYNQNESEGGYYQRPHRCEVCGRSYRHAGSLINHKQTHKTGVFRCSICQKRFFNLMAMKNHNRIHFELKRHKCLDCGKAFRLSKQLDTHQRLHWQRAAMRKSGRRNRRSTKCKKFGQSQQRKVTSLGEDIALMQAESSGKKDRVSPVKRDLDPDSRPYECEECGRSYRHAGSLFNHKKSHKIGQYCCSICHKTYSNLMAMKNHERNHFETKRHHCMQCGKTFRWKRQLTRHKFAHAHEEVQSGSQPPTEERQPSSVLDHQAERVSGFCKRSRKSSSRKKRNHFSNKAPSSKDLFCTACGIFCSTSDELRNHECTVRSIKMPNSVSSELEKITLSEEGAERPYGCEICGRTYRHAGSLLNHKNTHKKGLYKCSLCNKQFFNPMAIKNHLRTHTAEKKFQCKECGQAFRSSRQLVYHIRIHAGARPIRCLICHREFSSKWVLKRHQRTHKKSNSFMSSSSVVPSDEEKNIHTKDTLDSCEVELSQDSSPTQDQKYKCNQCDRSYRHAGSLFNHKKTHRTGVYKCSDCFKVFFNLLAYKNHLRIHKYPCKDCGKAFRIAGHLAAHQKIHEHPQLTHSPTNDVLDTQIASNLMVEVT